MSCRAEDSESATTRDSLNLRISSRLQNTSSIGGTLTLLSSSRSFGKNRACGAADDCSWVSMKFLVKLTSSFDWVAPIMVSLAISGNWK